MSPHETLLQADIDPTELLHFPELAGEPDPFAIAYEALAKLKAAGHRGVIGAPSPRTESTLAETPAEASDTNNVTSLAAYVDEHHPEKVLSMADEEPAEIDEHETEDEVEELLPQPTPPPAERVTAAPAPKHELESPLEAHRHGPHRLRLIRPYVNLAEARQVVPEVFKDTYDAAKRSARGRPVKEQIAPDRLVMREMVKFFRNDPSVLARVHDTFGIDRPQGQRLTQDTAKDFLSRAAGFRLLRPAEEISLATAMHLGVMAYKRLQKPAGANNPTLFQLAKEGAFAYEAFFSTNLKLVVAISRSYAHQYPHIEEHDVRTHAYIGMQSAIEKFDPKKGFKFSTYAMNWIKQAIDRGLLEDGRIIDIPGNVQQHYMKVERIRKGLIQTLEREPTVEEICDITAFDPDYVVMLQRVGPMATASLNKPIGEDGETELGDMLASEDPSERNIEDLSNRVELQNMFARTHLTPVESLMLSLCFGIRMEHLEGTVHKNVAYETAFDQINAGTEASVELIGRVTREKRRDVTRIINTALDKIAAANPRKASNSQSLDYLG